MKLFGTARRKKTNSAEDNNYKRQRAYILSPKTDFYVREAYKSLRTNIIFSLPNEGCKRICVTSAIASEGKSITVLNIALTFAEAGQRVLLIDGDLRRPSQSKLMERKASPGLSNILVDKNKLETAIHRGVYTNLDVIFSGDIPPNPSELLGHERMKQLLDQLSEEYDYIFVDTPPVNVVTDACVLSRVLDGVLFVVRRDDSESNSVTYAISQLEFAEAKLLGFILNAAEISSAARYGYSKYRKYGKYGYSKYGYRYGYKYGYYGHGDRSTEGASETEQKKEEPRGASGDGER